MKRTAEYILAIGGTLVSLFLLISGIILMIIANKQSYLDILYNKWSNEQYELLLVLMGNIGVDWILPGAVGIVLGSTLIYCLKKKKFIFVLAWASIIGPGLITFFSAYGSLSAIFFIITGLIILVRKSTSMGERM